jgi:hypothetical protein
LIIGECQGITESANWIFLSAKGTDCRSFPSKFFNQKKSELSVQIKGYFSGSAFLMEMEMEMEGILALRTIGSEIFKSQIFWYGDNKSENESETIFSEMDEIQR